LGTTFFHVWLLYLFSPFSQLYILGTIAYTPPLQTFVTTVVMIRSVDIKTFQEVLFKLWPYYFGLQAAGAAVLALTTPGSLLTHSGISGFLAPANRWGTLVPIAATFVSSLANLFVALPATIKVEQERYGQGDCIPFHPNALQVVFGAQR
jgi:hypothetical protein